MNFKTLGTRSLIAAIFIPLILLASLKGGLIFVALVATIVIFATIEFFDLVRRKITNPQIIIGTISALGICIAFYFLGPESLWWVISAAALVIICFELFRNQVAPSLNVSVTLFGLCYVPLLFGHMILIRELPKLPSITGHEYYEAGRWIIMMFITVWVCDTAAYLLGSAIGKHKLFERISPNKTWEGAIAGFITALLTAWICYILFIDGLKLMDTLVIGAICGTFGQMSDLIESQFKRDVQVKDASGLIPGHGGMLDRFDSLIVIAPLVYFYLRFIALT